MSTWALTAQWWRGGGGGFRGWQADDDPRRVGGIDLKLPKAFELFPSCVGVNVLRIYRIQVAK